MNTPIVDFIDRYRQSEALRLHMPGHKGNQRQGMEPYDITEIDGADSLYEASGIIRESEQNAGSLFGAHTFYSTEGSSQCIRAMVYLSMMHAKQHGRSPRILAGRNAHRAFITAVALLDVDVEWLYPSEQDGYLSCSVEEEALECALLTHKPTALYLTSPDYLGNTVDICAAAQVCRRHGVLLLVDNAHGAYLKFLQPSCHPMDLGADLCCDSAHKTLPVLTGGAYLHISKQAPSALVEQAKSALALFGSTSPSYLILRSLDAVNAYLCEEYPIRLQTFTTVVQQVKSALLSHGYRLYGNEPLKLTLCTKPYGYEGYAFAQLLQQHGLVCEFADPDFVVLMLTPELGEQGLHRLREVLLSIQPQPSLVTCPPTVEPMQRVLSVREAIFAEKETIPVTQSVGRVLASTALCCPPAVSAVVGGERITEQTRAYFEYYGIVTCSVVK